MTRATRTSWSRSARPGRFRSGFPAASSSRLETFLEIIGICGFELPTELVPRDESANESLRKNALLSPERRVQRALRASSSDASFDPYAILASLERRRTAYVVIGPFRTNRPRRRRDDRQRRPRAVSSATPPSPTRARTLRPRCVWTGRRGHRPRGNTHRPAARGVQHLQGQPQGRARAAGTAGATTTSDERRRASRSEEASRAGGIDRRPRTHARRPRTRTGRPKLLALRRLQALEPSLSRELAS